MVNQYCTIEWCQELSKPVKILEKIYCETHWFFLTHLMQKLKHAIKEVTRCLDSFGDVLGSTQK